MQGGNIIDQWALLPIIKKRMADKSLRMAAIDGRDVASGRTNKVHPSDLQSGRLKVLHASYFKSPAKKAKMFGTHGLWHPERVPLFANLKT